MFDSISINKFLNEFMHTYNSIVKKAHKLFPLQADLLKFLVYQILFQNY